MTPQFLTRWSHLLILSHGIGSPDLLHENYVTIPIFFTSYDNSLPFRIGTSPPPSATVFNPLPNWVTWPVLRVYTAPSTAEWENLIAPKMRQLGSIFHPNPVLLILIFLIFLRWHAKLVSKSCNLQGYVSITSRLSHLKPHLNQVKKGEGEENL